MPKVKGDGLRRGRYTGLKVSKWWTRVLIANFKKRLTDAELLKLYYREFPQRKQYTPRVHKIRWDFTNGLKSMGTRGVKANPPSIAYDAGGDPLTRQQRMWMHPENLPGSVGEILPGK